MNDRIKFLSEAEESYTAKEAMQQVVAYMQTKTSHAIGIFTIEDSKETGTESLLFVKMFMRFLHKNSRKVFLLAKNEDILYQLKDYVEERYPRIHIVETASWEENVTSYDMILNRINGAEADCVITAISTENQEMFLGQYRTALDAKIWLGLGTNLKKKKNLFASSKFGKFISRIFGGSVKKSN